MEQAQPTWAHPAPRSGVSSPASNSHAALPDVDYGAMAATQAAALGMGTASANSTARAQLQGRSSRSSTAASAAPSSGAATGTGHGGSSAAGPSTNVTTVSPHDSETSPPPSGSSTPSRSHSGRPQVLETHHLQLQTHTSGRRMINQYIIEDELGRGVHGKVRLARDTDTGERVAVKIVEREGRKRLGGGSAAWNSRNSALAKGKSRDRPLTGSSIISAASEGGRGLVAPEADEGSGDNAASSRKHHAHFAAVPPPSPGSSMSGAYALAMTARHGRWAESGPSRPTAADKELEREREKAIERARKQLLWTTDKKVKREIALMKKCAHENVVRLKEVIDDPQSKKIFMVLEYMSGGEVQWKDERGFPTLTIAEARSTLRDVVLGLEYLHYQGIIHRDIKPANLLWDENRRVKISDFGVSHFSYALLVASGGLPSLDGDEERTRDPSLVDDHELAKTAGSPAFFAPELCLAGEAAPTASSDVRINGRMRATPRMSTSEASREFPWAEGEGSRSGTPSQEHGQAARKQKPRITKAIDVWALGVTLYCLLFGHPPFTADNEFALFAVIPHEDYELPAFAGADRMRIGPRAKRWRTLPQWTDEESDVHIEPDPSEQDVGPAALSEDMRLLRELLDRLLEKDPEKRIKLEEVKKHPWLTRDLEDAPAWLSQTDPTQHPFVEVTHEEVEDALTGFSKIKLRIKRWQSKLLETLAGSRSRERSKSASHAHPPILNLSGSLRPNGAVSHGASTPAARDMGASLSQPNSAHGKSPGHSHRPGFFFRRQSTAADRVPSAVAELTALNSRESTRGRRARKYAGTRSQPASRPTSPDGSGAPKQSGSHGSSTPDAEALLRNLSATSSQGQQSLGSSARKLRPPVIQRRSTSRSTKTIEAARQMMPVFHRSSSESQTSDVAGQGFKLQTAPDGSLLVQPTASTRSSSKSARSSPLMSAGSGAGVWPSRRASANPGSESPRFSYDLLRAPTNDTVTAQPTSHSPPRQLSQRQTSRSRIGDIFRSVWHPSHGYGTPTKSGSEWQQDGLSRRSSRSSRSRPPSAQPRTAAAPPSAFRAPDSAAPSAALQKSALAESAGAAPHPSSGLTVDAIGAAVRVGPYGDADVPYSAPLPPRSLAAEEHRQRIVCSPSRPVSPVRVASTSTARRVDVDDVDVDLELSDDDDELGSDGRTRGSYLRNDGRGWVMHRGDGAPASIGSSSLGVSAPASEAHSGSTDPAASVTSFMTPSVEGGYNLFKPPYTGGRGHDGAYGSMVTPLPIEPVHGDSASALFSDLGPDHLKHALAHRRGSSFGRDIDSAAPLSAFHAERAAHGEHPSPGEADEGAIYSGTDDDRFADADESDLAASGALDDAEEDDDCDDDGGGFSFEAGRHGR